jgi:hypothetical protein
VAGDVRQAAAEGEQRREREQVAVDDPVNAGCREREVVLDRRDRDRDDRWSMKVIETAKIIAARINLLF